MNEHVTCSINENLGIKTKGTYKKYHRKFRPKFFTERKHFSEFYFTTLLEMSKTTNKQPDGFFISWASRKSYLLYK